MLIKYTFGSKSQTLRMRYPFQFTSRPISHHNRWLFCVYIIPLQDFVPEWNSHPGTRTGVNSHWGDLRQHDILWWYHVNKYRAVRGNQSELASGQKSPRCHVNTLLHVSTLYEFQVLWLAVNALSGLYLPSFCSFDRNKCLLLLKEASSTRKWWKVDDQSWAAWWIQDKELSTASLAAKRALETWLNAPVILDI